MVAGTSTTTGAVNVYGSGNVSTYGGYLAAYDLSGNNYILTAYMDGSSGNIGAANVTAVSFNATSDYRVKTSVRELDDAYNVDLLRPVIYHNTLLGKNDIGFIAHEIQEQYPFMVSGEKDGEQNQAINYNSLIGILVKEVQDLKREVNYLRQAMQLQKE